jgi:hypothetical protein
MRALEAVGHGYYSSNFEENSWARRRVLPTARWPVPPCQPWARHRRAGRRERGRGKLQRQDMRQDTEDTIMPIQNTVQYVSQRAAHGVPAAGVGRLAALDAVLKKLCPRPPTDEEIELSLAWARERERDETADTTTDTTADAQAA